MKPIAALFISSLLVGQVPTSLNFGSPAVSPPIPSATKVGATGFTNTFYWVVARTPGGYSSPGAAIATNTVGSANFSVSNYVVISWPAISGATGYDVIRSDSPSYPASTSCASCAVALNQAGTSFSDQGGATSAYSGGAQSVASQAIFTLDNVTVATPQINVQILNSRQNVTFALPSTGVGTVTSVGMTVPGALLSVSGSPITTSGTLAVSLLTQTANCVFAGPTSGGAATPTCRALVSADLPAGTGTVTSVGLSLPSIITVSGSPVTGAGTLTGTLATQTANTIWAGPTTGAAAAPTFRALVAADMPTGVIPTGNAVGGATNLTTVGAVPYVSASGVLNQDASNFFWDATNHRLGIGTNAPAALLSVTNIMRVSGGINSTNNYPASGVGFELGYATDISSISGSAGSGTGASLFTSYDRTGASYKGLSIDSSDSALKVSGTSRIRLASTGSVGIGSSNTSPANATLSVLDATPASGATATWIGHDGSETYSGVHLSALTTSLKVVAGLTQGSTNLQEWQSNAGTVLASVSSGGGIVSGVTGQSGSVVVKSSGNVQKWYIDGAAGDMNFASAAPIGWSSTSSTGTPDTSLSRCTSTAGCVAVGTGAAGSAVGQLNAGKALLYDSTASTGATTLAVKAGAGQSSTNLLEVQNNSGTALAAVMPDGGGYFQVGNVNGFSMQASGTKYALFKDSSTGLQLHSGWPLGWGAGAATGTLDTSLSRISDGVVGVGTGAAGSVAGTLQAATLQALGNGSASNPMLLGTGTWFTGGSATTTKPYVLIEPSGTTSTGWSTSGTGLGVNAASGFAGNLLDLQVAGVRAFRVTPSGAISEGALQAAASGYIGWDQRALLKSPADGVLSLNNWTSNDFNRLQFGGTTSSFPSIKRSTTGLIARLADDSADTWMQASQFRSTLTTPASAAATGVTGTIVADADYIYVAVGTNTWKRVAIATW